MGIPNLILFFTSNGSLDHKSPNSCLWTDWNNFYFFDLEIRLGFQIRYCSLPQMTHWTTHVQFLVYGPIWIIIFLWLGNSMGIPNLLYWSLTQMTLWAQKFVIMIRCKINNDIIWYYVIFAANLYLSIFIWSSDILNFVFMNVVILVYPLLFYFIIITHL